MSARPRPVDFRAVFERTPAPLLLLDPDFVIIDASDTYLDATMTTREFLVGRHLFDAFPDNPDDPTADGTRNLAASLERVKRTRQPDTMPTQKYDVRRPESEGGGFETRYWSPSNTPVLAEDGRLLAIVHRGQDITELTLHRELATHSAEQANALQERLFLHTRELQQANARLVELDRVKSDFLSRMSHELRTPLNAVIGFAQLLELDEIDDSRSDAVEHILRAGRHLLALINDVLDISRIEAGRLTVSIEVVPVNALITAAVDLVRPLADQHSITVTVSTPDDHHVRADHQRAVQILVNLLSNAVKYNRPNGSVDVRSESAGGRVRILVADTGVGIPDEVRPRLFQPFDRLGQEQSDIEGTGVGLTLARDLAARIGGSLELVSSSSEGTTFALELAAATDIRPLRTAAAPPDRTGSVEAHPVTVLYIEDNPANQRLMTAIVARLRNVTLLTAGRGLDGVASAIEHRPDLVLLDIHLPDINGDEVLARLRAHPTTATGRVVFLSADALPDHIKRMTALGADGYLTKPLDLPELIRVIDESRPPN